MANGFHPKLIFCPTDFSDSASLALRYAAEFARCFQSRLLVVYIDSVNPPPYFTESQIDELLDSMKRAREAARRHLEKYVDNHLGHLQNAETEIVDGMPVSAILRTAEERDAGLIVMGAHGMSGFNRLMLGSVTERVLRETDRPVLIVPTKNYSKAVPPPSIARILCPVNYSEVAFKALQHAASVAECFNAELLALHVVEPNETEEGEEEFRQQLCSHLSPEQQTTCKLRQLILKGNPAEKIIAAAASNGCDMIVLGAQHKRFFDATVIGKTTVQLTRHSVCPVLTVIRKEQPVVTMMP
jgi:nucleotide-binding universal stress UspA family protein